MLAARAGCTRYRQPPARDPARRARRSRLLRSAWRISQRRSGGPSRSPMRFVTSDSTKPSVRYLPFWVATAVEWFVIIAVPLLVVVLPLVRFLPAVMRWRVRSRIYRWYASSSCLNAMSRCEAARFRSRSADQLDRIEHAVSRSAHRPVSRARRTRCANTSPWFVEQSWRGQMPRNMMRKRPHQDCSAGTTQLRCST